MKKIHDDPFTDYIEKYQFSHDVYKTTDTFIAINNELKTYCSIQIVQSKTSVDPLQAADNYFQWLSRSSFSMIKATFDDHTYKLYFRFLKIPLLTLTLIHKDHQKSVFTVSGGLLAKKNQKGLFTFKRKQQRENDYVIALEQFESSLPWLLYKNTQAPIHEIVMKGFQKHKRG